MVRAYGAFVNYYSFAKISFGEKKHCESKMSMFWRRKNITNLSSKSYSKVKVVERITWILLSYLAQVINMCYWRMVVHTLADIIESRVVKRNFKVVLQRCKKWIKWTRQDWLISLTHVQINSWMLIKKKMSRIKIRLAIKAYYMSNQYDEHFSLILSRYNTSTAILLQITQKRFVYSTVLYLFFTGNSTPTSVINSRWRERCANVWNRWLEFR